MDYMLALIRSRPSVPHGANFLSLRLCFRRTPLHAAILNNNVDAFSLLLTAGGLNLELKDSSGLTVLWLSLNSETFNLEDSDSYARRLVAHGSSPNTLLNDNGNLCYTTE